MSIFHVNQIEKRIIDIFGTKIGVNEELRASEQIFKNKMSCGLSCYAIKILDETADEDQVVKSLVDGGDDNGIDLIYYNDEIKNLYLVQSKWNQEGKSEPELGDIQKFTNGIRDLLWQRFRKFNKKVNDRITELQKILLTSGVRITGVLVYTAINQSDHSKAHLADFCEEINDVSDTLDFVVLNQTKLYESITTGQVQITSDVRLLEWGHIKEPYKACYGQMSALDIASLYREYGKSLFQKNIRSILGDTEINQEIKSTLINENELFWYLNNGITIVCDDIQVPPGKTRLEGTFHCVNMSIINGAQTVGTIGALFIEENGSEEICEILGSTYVPTRLITCNASSEELSDSKFPEKLIRANNRQNKIESRDFITLETNQKRIQSEIALLSYKYNLHRSEQTDHDDSNLDIEEATKAISQFTSVEAAVKFSREKNKIWSDPNHNDYVKLFNLGTTGCLVINLVIISRQIKNLINKYSLTLPPEQKTIIDYADDFISAVGFELIDKRSISRTVLNFKDFTDVGRLEATIQPIMDATIKIVSEGNKIPANVFKSVSDTKTLHSQVLTVITGQISVTPLSMEEAVVISIEQSKISAAHKRRLKRFCENISGNIMAVDTLSMFITELNLENLDFGVVRNLAIYKNGDSPKADRFLFKLSLYKHLYLQFEYGVFDTIYKSILIGDPSFTVWAARSGYDGGKVAIQNKEQIADLIKLIKQ